MIVSRVGVAALQQQARSLVPTGRSSDQEVARHLRTFVEDVLREFPYQVRFEDWEGNSYEVGRGEPHWRGAPLIVRMKTPEAGRDILGLNGMRFLERFLEESVDIEGNLYILSDVRLHAKMGLNALQAVPRLFRDKLFQDSQRSQANVKSHYDIPQEALNVYLDRVYMSYSSGMHENPEDKSVEELTRIGKGQEDDWDSLEKAQWRKFKDAADFIDPRPGDTCLDVGCGYGGQLVVNLENHPFGKVVGWTHSANQAREGARMLEKFDPSRWELNEGDYRQDTRVFDHIQSTGMISHVGPRGLAPYVKNVRKRIKRGGRYVHHALMIPYSPLPMDFTIGITFNKKYVWPGFHWFTVGEHVQVLERNGFEVTKLTNLSPSYGKTTACWYERLMANRELMVDHMGEATVRAWQIFLAGISGNFVNKGAHVYRIYCVAV